MDVKKMGFRERLRMELYYNGMTAKELAMTIGVPYSTIQQYLSKARSLPNVQVGVKIAETLHTTVEYLVTGTDEKLVYRPEAGNQALTALSYLPDNLIKSFENIFLQIGDLNDKTVDLQKKDIKKWNGM